MGLQLKLSPLIPAFEVQGCERPRAVAGDKARMECEARDYVYVPIPGSRRGRNEPCYPRNLRRSPRFL